MANQQIADLVLAPGHSAVANSFQRSSAWLVQERPLREMIETITTAMSPVRI